MTALRYLSVCSGIEAASVAWHPLGWQPAAFSEIEAAPRAILAHHYPEVPLHGDFTTIRGDEYGPVDLLVGGTPCQSFSIAGLRGGLDDERGNLALEYLRLADRLRARWLVWENVPGVLSSNGGRDFGAILGGMAELGYGFAYRVLDAQHFGVPQRRRRVFVVGYLGDWRPAAAVLFERQSLSGHPAPRREARASVAALTANGVGTCGADDNQGQAGHLIASTGNIAHCLNAGGMGRQDYETETLIAHTLRGEGYDASEDGTGRGVPLVPVPFSIMPMNSGKDYKAREVDVAQPLMAGGPVGGNQGGDFVVQPVAFDTTQVTSAANRSNPQPGDPCHPLAAGAHPPAIAFSGQMSEPQVDIELSQTLQRKNPQAVAYPIQEVGKRTGVSTSDVRAGIGIGSSDDPMYTLQAGAQHGVAYDLRGREGGAQFEGPHDTANIRAASGGSSRSYVAASAVRRLTPRECERLQGFPDDYTLVPYRGRMIADGPRYKALGNSMAVPVMRWIGERIAMVEALTESLAA